MGDLSPLTDPSHAPDFPLSPRLRFSHSSERPPTHFQLSEDRAHIRDHMSYLEATATSSSLGVVTSTDAREEPSHPPIPADSPNADQPPIHPRKSRKDKMRIKLSSDQPPTTQGQPRTRVYVACTQWCAPLHLATILFLSSTLSFSSRVRKIRCDGAKPVCFHCCQRGGNEQCSYDTLPKRRGPDRVQGARTRGTRPKEGDGVPPRRRRRRTATVDQDTAPPEAGSSDGTKRPPVTGNAPAPDILGDPVPDVHQQNAGTPNIPLEVSVFQSLGSGVRFNSTASHDPTLALYQNHVSDFRFIVIVWCSRIFSHMTQET